MVRHSWLVCARCGLDAVVARGAAEANACPTCGWRALEVVDVTAPMQPTPRVRPSAFALSVHRQMARELDRMRRHDDVAELVGTP